MLHVCCGDITFVFTSDWCLMYVTICLWNVLQLLKLYRNQVNSCFICFCYLSCWNNGGYRSIILFLCSIAEFASCLIYAQKWASANFVDSWCPFRCSFGCVLLLHQIFWKQCTIRQFHTDLSDQSALEIRVRIRVSIFHREWRKRLNEHLIFRIFHGR